MPVKPEEVVAGACFATAASQVRRIVEITADGRVNYQARGRSFRHGENSWGPSGVTQDNWPNREEFASQVERQVRCDWDPDFSE